jgi:hypothetical protein
MSDIVEYVIRVAYAQAEAALRAVDKAASTAQAGMKGLGVSVSNAEKAMGAGAAATNAMAGALEKVAANATTAKTGLSGLAAQAEKAAAATSAASAKMAAASAPGRRGPSAAENAAIVAADRERMRQQGFERDPKTGNWVPIGSGKEKRSPLMKGGLFGYLAGYEIGKAGLHEADKIISASDDLEQYRRKWNALNENHQVLDKVIDQTRDISRKHKIMDRVEVAHLADELRGNLGSLEQASHHLDDAAREVARRKRQMIAHGHTNTEEAVRDVAAISKSAEIGVATTGLSPEEYGKAFTEYMRKLNVATMTANIKPEEYLGAQRLIGSTAFQNMNDKMKFGFLPSFVQENQKRAGFMWQQFDQRFFAGKGFSAPAMNELYGLGLVNIDPATTPDKFNPKTGLPKAQQDPRLFKEGDRLMKDKLDWIWNVLEPAMEAKYGDDKLRNAQAAAMFMSPRAAALFGEVVSQHAKWARNIKQQEQAWQGRERPEDVYSLGLSRNKAMRDAHGKDSLAARQRAYYRAGHMETDEPFEGYRQAKQEVAASVRNLEIAMKDIRGPATQGLKAVSGLFDWLEQQVSEAGQRATRKRWNLPVGGFAGSTPEEMQRWWRGDAAVDAEQKAQQDRVKMLHDHSGLPHQQRWGNIAQSAGLAAQVNRQIDVRTTIKVEAPPAIAVQVTGDVNLPGLGNLKFGGNENLPLSARAPRGEALQPNAQTP